MRRRAIITLRRLSVLALPLLVSCGKHTGDGEQSSNADLTRITCPPGYTVDCNPEVICTPNAGCHVVNLCECLSPPPPPPPPASVLTQHNDNGRTGANRSERALTPSNVAAQFGFLYDLAVQGVVYAQPLVAANVTISGTLYSSVVYVVTMHNMLYAFDSTAATPTLLLSKQLETPTAAQDPIIGNCNGPNYPAGVLANYNCYGTQRATVSNIPGEIGILSTPVIVGSTMYLMTTTGAGTNNHHVLHAVDITTFNDVTAPQVVTHADGTPFPSFMHIQRPALLAANGNVYAGFGSYCDAAPYQGRLVGFDATTLKPKVEWSSNPTMAPSRGAGGIWQSGQGPAADASGNVYLATGNGYQDSDTDIVTGGLNAAEAIVKLGAPPLAKTTMTIADWFVPPNYKALNAGDGDLGSGAVLLIPDLPLFVGGGKDSTVYVGLQSNLGHTAPSVQAIPLSAGNIKGTPVYWNGPGGSQIYVWVGGDGPRAFHYNGATFDPSAVGTIAKIADPGGMLSISANGSNNGILWATRTPPSSTPSNSSCIFCPRQGSLVAFDATNVQTVLWDSAYEASSSGFVFSKNAAPTIANGRVFVSSFGPLVNIGQQPPQLGSVRVFGLGAHAQGFGNPTPWSNIAFNGSLAPSPVANPTQLADVNGDGKADGVAFDGTQTWVMLSTGSGFAAPTRWSSINFYGLHDAYSTWLGDIDGVNGADAVAFDGNATWVMLSNGSNGFGAPFVWPGSTVNFYGTLAPSVLANPTQLADVNGDGKADAVAFDGSQTWVMLSTGSGFLPPALWSSTSFYGLHDAFSTRLADVDGKNGADAVAFDGTTVRVMLSNGVNGFGPPQVWSGGVAFYGTLAPSVLANPTQLADVNGDGKADAVAFDGTQTWVMLSTGSNFAPPSQWSNTNFYGTHDKFATWLGDVNGDGLADGVAFDGSSTWVTLGVR